MHRRHSPHELARIAECAEPDSEDSPGARFLIEIADHVIERSGKRVEDYDMLAHEIADFAVVAHPYSHDLWMTFVDLAAYRERDGITEAAEAVAGGDHDGYAAAMLYSIGHRLARRLLDQPDSSA
jgi:hypothetical protein